YEGDGYSLNIAAGICVDVARFDAVARAAERRVQSGDVAKAVQLWLAAAAMYRGDLYVSGGIHAMVQRERLRGIFLSLMGCLAAHYFHQRDYRTALSYARRLLAHDPCREDAHRLVMRCHVRLGEGAQALRRFAMCRQILVSEF